jgi:hypothetical protein
MIDNIAQETDQNKFFFSKINQLRRKFRKRL